MTMIQLRQPTADDLLQLCANIDPGMRAEQEELSDVVDAAALAETLLGKAAAGLAHVIHDSAGLPVLAAGFTAVEPWVLQSWMVARADWRTHHVAITDTLDAICARILAESGFRRLQVLSMVGRPGVSTWLGRMGFLLEGVQVGYGRTGANFAMYARTARRGN